MIRYRRMEFRVAKTRARCPTCNEKIVWYEMFDKEEPTFRGACKCRPKRTWWMYPSSVWLGFTEKEDK